MTFRKTIFWLHLACGVIAGLSIGIMCFTGTILAFEKELAAWAERDARRVEVPATSTPRLSLEDIQRKLRETFPDARPMTVVVQNDPAAAIGFPAGRTAGYYVNPYTGEVRQPQSSAIGRFMQRMLEWHRYLGFSGAESRPRGKWINGACNLAFAVLAISGLYLWIPRTLSLRGIRAVALFNWKLTGRARDFNWHNTIGLWSAPILIVLTLTAVPISFQWGGRVINTLTGTPQPASTAARGPAAAAAQPAVEIPAPAPGTARLSQDALVAAVQKEVPTWKTITLRADSADTARAAGAGGRAAGRGATPGASVGESERRTTVPAATFTVRETNSWPRTANTTVAVNPYTGEIVRRSGYADMPAPQQVRAWTRFLHTGEALGWGGQLIAGLACAGGCVLVWTGLALAWRRFFGPQTPAATMVERSPSATVAGRSQ
jgi:uncharacterized iron-regulated membrane protein